MESEKIDVKSIREELGLSKQEFANKIGVERRTVDNYEKGSIIPETRIRYFKQLIEEKRNFKNSSVNNNIQAEEIKALKEHIETLKEFVEIYKSENKLLKEKIFRLELE